MSEKKMTSSRRHHLKSVILQVAQSMLEQEKADIEAAKEAYMAEHCPTPETGGDQAALMVRIKKITKKSNNQFQRQVRILLLPQRLLPFHFI
ncbi:troponin I, fast skeletal muscle [Oryzias melastigma]|uniref:troponin I, fast skeletal muscle n=1 Tax=Oryzias melastigma TaxID=30732 RepID=UPI000CF7E65A|nr:troponin I, fast skeletal muscle [Oryzias melastigma]